VGATGRDEAAPTAGREDGGMGSERLDGTSRSTSGGSKPGPKRWWGARLVGGASNPGREDGGAGTAGGAVRGERRMPVLGADDGTLGRGRLSGTSRST
jgi:hypothetical protein